MRRGVPKDSQSHYAGTYRGWNKSCGCWSLWVAAGPGFRDCPLPPACLACLLFFQKAGSRLPRAMSLFLTRKINGVGL
jgi:hypothetical protein